MPTTIDLASVVNTAQQTNVILTKILAVLQGGVAISPTPTNYAVASLPATAANGQYAFATDGRKPGEGGGAGTGVPVFFNSATATWFSYCSGAVVTV